MSHLPRFTRIVVVLALLSVSSPQAQATQLASPQHAAHEGQHPTARVFASDAGIVLNFTKPDKTGDFEAIIAKLKDALQKSAKPKRKQQATGWKVLRSPEPGPNSSVLCLFLIDPAVKGADYTVSNILAEAFSTEIQALYKQYMPKHTHPGRTS